MTTTRIGARCRVDAATMAASRERLARVKAAKRRAARNAARAALRRANAAAEYPRGASAVLPSNALGFGGNGCRVSDQLAQY